MERLAVAAVFLLVGCGSLVTEQRMARLDTAVRSIQQDFSALSATFTPEQNAKYARARATQDDSTFQEFYASLNEQQRAMMKTLLERARQAEQERALLSQTVRQDLAMQQATRRRLPRGFFTPPSVL
jgi:hypothetical protein